MFVYNVLKSTYYINYPPQTYFFRERFKKLIKKVFSNYGENHFQ